MADSTALALSRPSAFFITPVLTGTTDFRITSFDCWQDRVVVGCEDGSLRGFGRAEASEPSDFLLIFHKPNFAFRSIDCLTIIEPLGVIVSISDSRCGIHDLTSFAHLGSLDTGGSRCTSVAVNDSCRMAVVENPSHPYLLAVLSRSKLHVFQWKGVQLRFQMLKAFTLSERVTALEFVHNSLLCLAYRTRYDLLQIDSGQFREMVSVPSTSSEPLIAVQSLYRKTVVPKKLNCTVSEIVGSRSESLVKIAVGVYPGVGVFTVPVHSSGADTVSSTVIQIDNPVVALLLISPYLLIMTQDGLHPVNIEADCSRARSIPFNNGFAVRSKSKQFAFAASHDTIIFIERRSIEDQINELCAFAKFDEALILLRHPSGMDDSAPIEGVERRLRYVNSLFAKHLFEEKRFAAALKRFQQSDIDPRAVLNMYSELEEEHVTAETISSLIPYLLHLRNSIPRSYIQNETLNSTKAAELATLIDTSLLKMYLKADRRLVIPFLTQSHSCDVDAAESALLKSKEYDALLFLLHSRDLHERSLNLLRSLYDSAQNEFTDMKPTISYLFQLMKDPQHWELVQKESRWVLANDPSSAVRIFADQYRRVSTLKLETTGQRVRSEQVLDFLLKTTSMEASILYLESFIELTGNVEPQFHDSLANLYLDFIQQNQESLDSDSIRIRMQAFLANSSSFDASALLERFPTQHSFLPKERAILLHKCERSEEALRTLALYDSPLAAMNFCDLHPLPSLQLHMMLLHIFLAPESEGALLDPALQLIQTHTVYINPAEAISLFPETLPVCKLRNFFEKMICLDLEKKRRNHVELHLSRGENRKAHIKLNGLLQQYVLFDGLGSCKQCCQILANTSTVIVRRPDGSIIDYKCCNEGLLDDDDSSPERYLP